MSPALYQLSYSTIWPCGHMPDGVAQPRSRFAFSDNDERELSYSTIPDQSELARRYLVVTHGVEPWTFRLSVERSTS